MALRQVLAFFKFYAMEGKGVTFSNGGDPTMNIGRVQQVKESTR
jgi:pyruvate-formate lyase-activating enzyme